MKQNLLLKTFLLLFISIYLNAKGIAKQSGSYQFKIGRYEVIALSDGTVPLDAKKLFQDNDPIKIDTLLKSAYVDNPVEASINAYLIIMGDKLVLIDAGAGELFGPLHGGQLVHSLQSAGFKPEQVTDILLTHIHNDHSGGLTVKDKPVFMNAIVHVNKFDTDYWLNTKRMEKADTNSLSSNKKSFINAINVFQPYITSGRVKTFQGNAEVVPDLRSLAAPGHTPGHCLYILEDGGNKLVFCGDLIHIASVQFADPTVIDGFDVDKKQAMTERVKIYHDAAENGYLLAGDHVSFPGVGRLRAKGKGYEWLPLLYSVEGRIK